MKKLKRMLRNRHISKFCSVILEDLEEYEPKFDISFVKDQYGIKARAYTPRDGFKHSGVGACCLGKWDKYKGYRWKYLD